MKQSKQKTLLTVFTIAAIVISSCNKNNDERLPIVNTAPPPANSKIKTQQSGLSETMYEYDNAGRVKKTITNGITDYEYNYTADSLIQTRYLANGVVMETYHIKLNNNGMVETYFNDKYPSIFIKYEFNADNKVAKKINYDNNILSNTTYYFYENGNLIKDSTVNQGGSPTNLYGRIYEYYTDKYSTIENINRGQAHWGVGNKNTLRKITYVNNGIASSTQEFQTPEVDALNRISKTGMTTNNAGVPVVYKYSYY